MIVSNSVLPKVRIDAKFWKWGFRCLKCRMIRGRRRVSGYRRIDMIWMDRGTGYWICERTVGQGIFTFNVVRNFDRVTGVERPSD